MENTNGREGDLVTKAEHDLLKDMAQREIAAIIWDVEEAGFHFIPEVELDDSTPEDPKVARVSGLYSYGDKLYLILEGEADIDYNDFYDRDSEVRPTVVTLTHDLATKYLGNPAHEKGFTTEGDLEQWLAVADCYFEALAEDGIE